MNEVYLKSCKCIVNNANNEAIKIEFEIKIKIRFQDT